MIISHLLHKRQPYRDLGADYIDKFDTTRLERHCTQRLERADYAVTLVLKVA